MKIPYSKKDGLVFRANLLGQNSRVVLCLFIAQMMTNTWCELLALQSAHKHPMVVMGDFNEVL